MKLVAENIFSSFSLKALRDFTKLSGSPEKLLEWRK